MGIREVLDNQLNCFKEESLQEEIIEKAQIVEVDAGAVILNEGTYVKTVPILISGLVKVAKQEGGKELLLYYIYPNESCIVSIHCGINMIKSRVKATAEENTVALLFPSSMIGEWQRKYPSFNSFVLDLYQKRFDDVLNAFNALAFQSLDYRLMSFLVEKSEALKSSFVKMTHQELGDELGTARETVSRLLKKLEVEEKVKLHRGRIEIQ